MKKLVIGLIICNIILMGTVARPLLHATVSTQLSLDPGTTVKDIQTYLTSISPTFIDEVQALAKKNNVPSWGCGPSSYALAQLLDTKFFDNKLKIHASYDSSGSYQIVERFAFAQSADTQGVDHAWLEIYLKDRLLFIDPTIGQFGKITGITSEVFAIGDPEYSTILLSKYGILDDRMGLLVRKAINRVPKDSDPYPGVAIQPKELEYYLAAYDDRNLVDQGKTPDSWKEWVDTLIQKFSKA